MPEISPLPTFSLDDAIALLTRTPTALTALLRDLPAPWTRATEGPETWSPYDVIGHLVHGERADWMPRVRHILAGTQAPFPPFDRAAQFAQAQDSLKERLATFAGLRAQSIAALEALSLTPTDLARTGQHPAFGRVTLQQLIATWVVHDLDHVTQITRTMAKRYAEEVGPWSAYLTVLRDREG